MFFHRNRTNITVSTDSDGSRLECLQKIRCLNVLAEQQKRGITSLLTYREVELVCRQGQAGSVAFYHLIQHQSYM